ncbi:MAG: SDR family NAD(P)-dependent oxidoreductase [Lentisphaeria bacterium]|nr:MAG: SDR family NAD(P)-dependent oxidoreductase [Lentisphaeria bacterium]
MNSAGKIAVVTGASSGLGRAVAREFRRRGFTVIALCRHAPEADTADRFLAVDLTDAEQRTRAAAAIEQEFGRLDVLVNNAGIGSYATWEELSEEELRREFELDFFAPVELTRALLPLLEKSRGSIVNISSVAAQIPVGCMGAYNAVKAALRMYSLTLRMEVAGRGIHVLNVCPGRVDTGFSSRALGGGSRRKRRGAPPPARRSLHGNSSVPAGHAVAS